MQMVPVHHSDAVVMARRPSSGMGVFVINVILSLTEVGRRR
jgi:hypothetical protein